MTTEIKKINLFLVITLSLILMCFIFPQSNAQAGTTGKFANTVYDFFTADENIEPELYQQVVDDAIQNGINMTGFDKKRFKTEEQEGKYRAAVIEQQVKNFNNDFKNTKGVAEKGEMLVNHKEHLSKNLQKSVNEVNKLIEKNGGNIDKVNLDIENFEVFGSKPGKKIINTLGKVTPDEYTNLRKMDEQLTREAYAELGVSDLPQNILNGLFNMSNNKQDFLKDFNKMSKSDKKWFEKSKTNYAYSAELTDDAINLMEAAGLSSMEELNQFYMNNKHQIKNMNDLKRITTNMKKDRQDLLDLLGKAKPRGKNTTQKNSNNLSNGQYTLDNDGILRLFSDMNNIKYGDIAVNGLYGGLEFDSPEDFNKFMTALQKFKEDYNWDFTKMSPDFQKLYTFYQGTPGDLDEPIKLAGQIDTEYHTFVSKVVFKITKKKGSIGNMNVADMNELNEVALKYNKDFAQVYKRLTRGNASPIPKVLSKDSNSITVELDYYDGIKNSCRGKFYDAARNNWSLIKGNHARPSLDYRGRGSNKGFVPTLAFENVEEGGVYEIEATIFADRYYQYEDVYDKYVDCWEDEDGNHHHGRKVPVEYFPYRQKKGDEHSDPTDNDTRNVAPDHISENHVIGQAMWEVNVANHGKIVIPPYGVDTNDIKISNFITK